VADAVLEIDRVSKRYGDLGGLAELSLGITAGEVFGLVGAPGSGKTTALRIALGLLVPDGGTVRWFGGPLSPAVRQSIGYLPGRTALYPRMRVLDQLVYLGELHGLPAEVAHRNAEYWIDRFGLRGAREQRVRRLGPDHRRRTRLAAALVPAPRLLVLDEPFAGLDDGAADALREILREQAQTGAAVLCTSEEFATAEGVCDRVGVLLEGRMVASGPAAELRESAPVRLVVDAPAATGDWAGALPGCRVVAVDGSSYELELEPGTNEQQVLWAALATGAVREFRRRPPTLAGLYPDPYGGRR
jgi:ABC-2 type transport system ATP-binding protein